MLGGKQTKVRVATSDNAMLSDAATPILRPRTELRRDLAALAPRSGRLAGQHVLHPRPHSVDQHRAVCTYATPARVSPKFDS